MILRYDQPVIDGGCAEDEDESVQQPPPMAPPPGLGYPPNPGYPPDHQEQQDSSHLNLLGIFHWVFAGLALLGVVGLLIHRHFMRLLASGVPPFDTISARERNDMEVFLDIFEAFYIAFGALLVVAFVVNILSGMFLRGSRNRLFSLIVAGVNCLNVPLGTALGVFTIMVLIRPSVVERYERNRPG